MDAAERNRAVRETLAAHAKLTVDVDTLGDEADLFAAGMTSLSSVNVMLALEERFDVEFPDELLNRNVFASIGAIAEAIASVSTTPA